MKRLTKSQYEAIASAIHDQRLAFVRNESAVPNEQRWNDGNINGIGRIARCLALRLAANDKEFKQDEFLKLCGIKD